MTSISRHDRGRADSAQSVCRIRSTLDSSMKAACLMQWGAVQALLTPDAVLTTARDLMAAAAAAETDIALIDAFRRDVRVPDAVIGQLLGNVRRRRPHPPGKTALRIEAVAGAKTGRPYVTIGRAAMKGQLTPDEARTMAVQWIETAVAAQIDVRTRYALGEWDKLTATEIEDFFSIVQRLAPTEDGLLPDGDD
jgi:hypothetical protein